MGGITKMNGKEIAFSNTCKSENTESISIEKTNSGMSSQCKLSLIRLAKNRNVIVIDSKRQIVR